MLRDGVISLGLRWSVSNVHVYNALWVGQVVVQWKLNFCQSLVLVVAHIWLLSLLCGFDSHPEGFLDLNTRDAFFGLLEFIGRWLCHCGRSGEQNCGCCEHCTHPKGSCYHPKSDPKDWMAVTVWNIARAPEACSAVEFNPNPFGPLLNYFVLRNKVQDLLSSDHRVICFRNELLACRQWLIWIYPICVPCWWVPRTLKTALLISGPSVFIMIWWRLWMEEREEGSFPVCGHGYIKCIPL